MQSITATTQWELHTRQSVEFWQIKMKTPHFYRYRYYNDQFNNTYLFNDIATPCGLFNTEV